MEAPNLHKDSDIPEGLTHNPRSNLEIEYQKAQIAVEGREFDCITPDGSRVSRIQVSEVKEILGKGNFAEWVASVRVRVSPDEQKGIDWGMVMKKFKDGELQDADLALETSILNYSKVRDAGIPTWTTYRRIKGEPIVLMTSGVDTDIESTFVTYNDPDVIIENRIHIENESFDTQGVIKQIEHICKTAADAYIALTPDSFGYVVRKNEKGDSDVKVIISDFDMIDDMHGFGYSYILKQNIEAAKKSVHGVFNHQGEGIEEQLIVGLDGVNL